MEQPMKANHEGKDLLFWDSRARTTPQTTFWMGKKMGHTCLAVLWEHLNQHPTKTVYHDRSSGVYHWAVHAARLRRSAAPCSPLEGAEVGIRNGWCVHLED